MSDMDNALGLNEHIARKYRPDRVAREAKQKAREDRIDAATRRAIAPGKFEMALNELEKDEPSALQALIILSVQAEYREQSA